MENERDEAIEDGIFLRAGAFDGFRVVVTENLLHTINKETLATLLVRALEIARTRMAVNASDLVRVPVGDTVAWVDVSHYARIITVMLPEDY